MVEIDASRSSRQIAPPSWTFAIENQVVTMSNEKDHWFPLDPKTMKNEGFTPQNIGYNP